MIRKLFDYIKGISYVPIVYIAFSYFLSFWLTLDNWLRISLATGVTAGIILTAMFFSVTPPRKKDEIEPILTEDNFF